MTKTQTKQQIEHLRELINLCLMRPENEGALKTYYQATAELDRLLIKLEKGDFDER